MTLSDPATEEWNAKRRRLQQALVAALEACAKHTGTDSFHLPTGAEREYWSVKRVREDML